MTAFDTVIASTWPTATERSDFAQHALNLAWQDALSPGLLADLATV